MLRLALQALLFLAAAAALGLAGNALHPDGLDLDRAYPRAAGTEPGGDPDGNDSDPGPGEPEDGFQRLDLEKTQAYWEVSWDAETESWIEENGIYFLDARRQKSFEAGHLPGAFLADPYSKELEYSIDEPLAKRLRDQAMLVVIYCTGSPCEDSITVASHLQFHWQIPPELIFIYEGGFQKWQEAGLPTTRS